MRYIPAILWAILIFGLSHSSTLPKPPLEFEGLDKLIHAGVFGVLAILVLYALNPRTPGAIASSANRVLMPKHIAIAWFVSTLYGVSDEWHQFYVPGRTTDVFDVVADSCGALIAIAIVALFLERKHKHQRSSA